MGGGFIRKCEYNYNICIVIFDTNHILKCIIISKRSDESVTSDVPDTSDDKKDNNMIYIMY